MNINIFNINLGDLRESSDPVEQVVANVVGRAKKLVTDLFDEVVKGDVDAT